MKNFVIAVLTMVSIIAFAGCSQKKIATTDPAPAPATKPATPPDKATMPAEPNKIPTESVTSLDKDKNASVPAYVRELQAKMTDVYFDYDSYDLSEEGKKAVRSLADILAKNNKVTVTVEGHCDERGTNEYNLALGDRRAKAVKDYLSALHVPANKVELISYGEEKPACTESTEACWAKNRRAHFALAEGNR